MRKNKGRALRLGLAVGMFFASSCLVFAQTNSGGASMSKSNMKPDERFVKEAASGGMAEVKLGKLAEEKGANEAVKNFGARMVQDHSKADDQLKSAASQSNMNVPEKIDAQDEATYNRLSKLSGAAFDREYAKLMVTDHTHDIAAFRSEALHGENSSIKEFASQTLPTLQEHLKLARNMEKSVSTSAANSSKAAGSY